MNKVLRIINDEATAALAGGGCRGDVRNNGRRITVYLHTRNRFSFYFCANTRPMPVRESSKTVDKRKRGDSSRTGTMKL